MQSQSYIRLLSVIFLSALVSFAESYNSGYRIENSDDLGNSGYRIENSHDLSNSEHYIENSPEPTNSHYHVHNSNDNSYGIHHSSEPTNFGYHEFTGNEHVYNNHDLTNSDYHVDKEHGFQNYDHHAYNDQDHAHNSHDLTDTAHHAADSQNFEYHAHNDNDSEHNMHQEVDGYHLKNSGYKAYSNDSMLYPQQYENVDNSIKTMIQDWRKLQTHQLDSLTLEMKNVIYALYTQTKTLERTYEEKINKIPEMLNEKLKENFGILREDLLEQNNKTNLALANITALLQRKKEEEDEKDDNEMLEFDEPTYKCNQEPINPGDKKPNNCVEALPSECDEGEFSLVSENKSHVPLRIYCKRDAKGGQPWQVVLQRKDGSTDFYLDMDMYVKGFGKLNEEFFVGLKKLVELTKKPTELWVHLEDFYNHTADAYYDDFKIEGKEYKLAKIGTYTGTAGDALKYHLHGAFAARDAKKHTYCQRTYYTALWRIPKEYRHLECYMANVFGEYRKTTDARKGGGIEWKTVNNLRGKNLKMLTMSIRPKAKAETKKVANKKD